MPLIDKWRNNRGSIFKVTIDQSAKIIEGGALSKNEHSQNNLGNHLNEVSVDTLEEDANYCLQKSCIKNAFIFQGEVKFSEEIC
jgi:hypothetical protein